MGVLDLHWRMSIGVAFLYLMIYIYPITTASHSSNHSTRRRETVAFALFVLPQSTSGSHVNV